MNSPNYTPGFWLWLRRSKYRRTTKRRLLKKHWRRYMRGPGINEILKEVYEGFDLSTICFARSPLFEYLPRSK